VLLSDRRAHEDDHESLVHKSYPKKLRSRKQRRIRSLLVVGIALLLVVAGGFFMYQYKQAQDDIKRLSNPQEAAKEEVRTITDKASKLVILPEGETPSLATVADPAKLQGQTFFVAAQKGDKVLVYAKAKRAIIYRPSSNKIVESSSVNIGNNTTPQTKTGTTAAPTITAPTPTKTQTITPKTTPAP
jgi:hypothetical protein